MAYDPTETAFSALVQDVEYDLDFATRFERLGEMCEHAHQIIEGLRYCDLPRKHVAGPPSGDGLADTVSALLERAEQDRIFKNIGAASEAMRLVGESLEKLATDVAHWNNKMDDRLSRKIKIEIERAAVAAAA